ncbi:unnamed protein product [Toxocara canis]|uniref:RIIa domain-containing protein n=1 Tax=Toxocara canis TaxID=6265 RepID=A0A183U0K2_TOXCA|nr:unnamed protein product [Toxocara canis]
MPQKARAYLMPMNGSNAVDEEDAAMLEEARGLLKAIPDTELVSLAGFFIEHYSHSHMYSRQQATEGIGESKTESIVQENEQKEELMDGKTEEVDRSNTATPTT